MMARDKETGVTAKQEKFAQLIVAGENQSDAYRGAGYSSKMADKTITEAASRLSDDSNVVARIKVLREPVVAKLRYDLEQAMGEAKAAYEMAVQCASASSMVSAVALRAKLNGLDVEPRKNDRGAFSEMTDDDLARAMVEVDTAIERAKKHAV